VARALAIPLVIHADGSPRGAERRPILVDGDQGIVHLRPEETVVSAFRDKMAMQARRRSAMRRSATSRRHRATAARPSRCR
jgi:phosphotransferase system enzyme I (PtsP)